ncbi:MAG: hypothetical protein O3B01_20240, partial [Planctomycetota bacterium]|nr:hypothetical protein [Planctomycetota bacterium]
HPDSFQSVKLHWASQWHLLNKSERALEKSVKTPLGKPVASRDSEELIKPTVPKVAGVLTEPYCG